MTDRIAHLRMFLGAAEASSFADAARRLAVSPQAVTRAVQALEVELGEVLFHRNTRSVRLSDRGRRFADQAAALLEQLDGLFAANAGPGGSDATVEGTVRLSAPTMQGRRFVVPVVARLAAAHPGLLVDLRLSDEVADPVAERIDVGVRVGRVVDSRFVARTVAQLSLKVCAAPALLARIGPVRTRRQLDAVPTTRLIDRNTGRAWPWSLRGLRDFLPARPSLVTDDIEAECAAVLAGAGVGQLAGVMAAPHLRSGALVEVLGGLAPATVPMSVYRVQRKPVAPRVRLVYDELLRALSSVE